MPEYLAPGVYVEETSFRAKSIEGVGTSTTGFVGATRTGPIGITPELITSFGDFERIYGGLNDLSFGPNYLAHSVRAYFNEGGSRLYVSRAFAAVSGGGAALSDALIPGAAESGQARIVARFPGSAGNGTILARETLTAATLRGMTNAPDGSLLRVGGGATPAAPARVTGAAAPFSIANDGKLLLNVAGADVALAFHGEPVEAIAATPLADNVTLDAASQTLVATVDGIAQTLPLPAGPTPRADLAALINRELRGGYARLTADEKLVIGTDARGKAASVTVQPNAGLGFAAATSVAGSSIPANNVNDLLSVTVDEINALLTAANVPARAALLPGSNRLALATLATGAAATLTVRTAADSVNTALGLAAGAATGTAGGTVAYFLKRGGVWRDSASAPLDVTGLGPGDAPVGGAELVTLTAITTDGDGKTTVYEEMGFDPQHPRYVGSVLAEAPRRRRDALENSYAFRIGANVDAFALRTALFSVTHERLLPVFNGNDGGEPRQANFEAALGPLDSLDDISIIAAPGASAYADANGITGAMISDAERLRAYRIAVLDTPPNQEISDARAFRSRLDSKYAALYYPWVTVSNPLARPGADNIPTEINLPPSGFMCGIYARSDVQRGVFKAPANEVVRGALRFEKEINFAQQEVLNPLGVNCLRSFPGRGYRVWGARTASSDPEWKYVNIRRYFLYLESSIDRGTQWAVFEPNGELLWANIRDTIGAFLYNEWVSGALLGGSPQEAYFVRCDRSTMTQNDLDNGRLICLIGVAAIKPAEFVIFRIGQKTADARA